MFFLPKSSWVVKKTSKKGRGVFATEPIEAGTLIGDYLGKVIHPSDEENLQDEACFYLMYYHDRASVFPDLKKPGIYLLNHSCSPNVWMYTYKGHTLFFALRHIFPGEELTVNYLLSPLDESCKPCQHLCKCGSVICHSNMHLTDEKYEKWSEFHEKQAKATKPERIRYNKMLKPLEEYPTSLPDDPLYTLFGTENEKPLSIKGKKLPSTSEVRKLIRESGRKLLFKDLNLEVLGVENDVVYTRSSK